MEDILLNAVKEHASGHVAKHKANIEVYLSNPTGIGEHSDIIQAIENELGCMAEWQEKLDMIKKHFMVVE